MDKVYVATSEYGIEAIFSTEKKAEEYKSAYNVSAGFRPLNDIEEYVLDIPKEEWLFTEVKMLPDGRVISIELTISYLGFHSFWGEIMTWVVKTLDKKRAIKVVNEKREQIIARDLWHKDKEVRELFEKE